MPPAKCAHTLSANKRIERVRSLIVFAKTASKSQLTSKLIDCWSQPHSTITEARILLTLGANPAFLYEDGLGQTELEERIENGTVCQRCRPKYSDFLEHAHTIYEAQFEQTPVLIPRNKRCNSGMIALSLDGGGMRGLVSVVCAMFASRRIFGDEYLPNVVDWCVGTSAGSLMGLSLMKGMTLTETFFMYWDMKNEIFMEGNTMKRLFGNMVDRQSRNMDEVLLKCFPDEFTFMNCHKRLTVPALDITTTPAKLHVFRNYSLNIDKPKPPMEDTLFRDAARASSAAPTYFSPLERNGQVLVDGSFVANCPLNILFKELDQCNTNGSKVRLAAVISIGTGEPRATTRRYNSNNSNTVGRGKNIMYMGTLFLEQVVGYEQSGLESAMDRCQAQDIPLVRLSPKGVNVRIDQIDDGKLMDMVWTTLLYLKENTREVDKLGEILFELLGEHSYKRVRSNTTL